MIPLQDTIRARRFPLMNYALIAVNVVLLVYQMRLSPDALEAFLTRHGTIPARFLADVSAEQVVTLVTSIFLHGGWLHLLSNMWALFIFGDNIEDRMGPLRYLLFYVVSGVVATLAHIYATPGSTLPVVGASGAIAGVMGAYLITYPRARVITLIPIGFLWFVQIPAVLYLGLWFALQLFSGVQTLSASGMEEMLRGMPRGLQHLEKHILQFYGIAFRQGHVVEGALGRLCSVYFRTGPFRQIHVSRNEISMKMGFKNVGDFQPHGTGFGDVDIDIPLRINDGASVLPRAGRSCEQSYRRNSV